MCVILYIAFSLCLWRTGERKTYHIDTINSTKLKTLILGVQNNVHHSTHFRRYDIISGDKSYAFLQPLLESRVSSLYAWLHHVTGHQFESLFKMLAELEIGPVQTADERLQRVELPEKILRSCATVPFDLPSFFLETLMDRLSNRGFHQVNVAHHQWRECVA